MILELLLVAVGGFFGAVVRYFIISKIKTHQQPTFPISTLLVNIFACFLFGFIASHWILSSTLKALLVTGFLGSLSTFSTLIQNAKQMSKKEKFAAVIYISLSVGLGLLSFEVSFWFTH